MKVLRKKLTTSKGVNTGGKLSVGLILKGTIIAFVFSLICFLVLALILSLSNITENIIKPTSYIVMIISVVLAGGYVARRAHRNGWMYGATTGCVYIIILTLLGLFNGGQFAVNQILISRFFIGIIAGAVGGALGINLK